MPNSRKELLRICRNCLYYDRSKHLKYDLYNHYCYKIKRYVGDTEWMLKDCCVLTWDEVSKK